jgi:ankyrin repeat protein
MLVALICVMSGARAEDLAAGASIHELSRRGDVAGLKALLERDPTQVRISDRCGMRALHRAAIHGSPEAVKLLIRHRAEVDARDSGGFTALHYAARNRHEALVRLLIQNGATPDIFMAIALRDKERTLSFLRADPDCIRRRNKRGTPLEWAVDANAVPIAGLLLDHGADVYTLDNHGYMLLHELTPPGRHGMLKLFLRKGADVNKKDFRGYTLLHGAVRATAAVGFLLERGATIDPVDRDGSTPLYCAVGCGNTESVKLLLSHGAQAEGVGDRMPLFRAVGRNFAEIAELLINNGADVNRKGPADLTALHFASYKGNVEVARLLIQKGADVNARSTIDCIRTPLAAAKLPPPTRKERERKLMQRKKEVDELLRAHAATQ